MCATSFLWRHLVNVWEVKAHLIGLLANLAPSVSGSIPPSVLSLIVAAVLRDSVWAVSLLPAWQTVVVCCILYACKVERLP